MACSSFEYVKSYEDDPPIPSNCWFILRVDGRSYGTFSDSHEFEKPNDKRACSLMVDSAQEIMRQFDDIILAYGQSDEFSFLFKRTTKLWKRRKSFDARITPYPTDQDVMDYFRWRQADCHINNLYNTSFWFLVKEDGKSPREAYNYLSQTNSADKNELLFSKFNTNYNSLPQLYRKGTIILRAPKETQDTSSTSTEVDSLLLVSQAPKIKLMNRDLISKDFWMTYFSDLAI